MVEKNSDGTWSATFKKGDKEVKFQFSKWGAEKSLLTFAELTKVASFGLADAVMLLNDVKRDQLLGTIISMFVKGIADGFGANPKQTLSLLKRFCCDEVFVNGDAFRESQFDLFFRDDIFLALDVARANIEAQYESFFARLAPVLQLLRGELQNVLQPSTQKI